MNCYSMHLGNGVSFAIETEAILVILVWVSQKAQTSFGPIAELMMYPGDTLIPSCDKYDISSTP